MKIDKLLTLSQFVELMQAKVLNYEIQSNMFGLVCKYNNFLKQPLTKDMFINPIEYPTWESVKAMPLTSEGVDGKYWRLLKEWQEAEKKVIFNHPKEESNIDIIILAAKTIGGYANAMGGEIEIKNVTI